ncbi:proteasome assembly chaperone 4 isoform X1 [Rhineura floridana]|uniref:proteasome assembly chaperone 4 isoform X1 n=1 Tax=Rhineura floridana TaxID=261503 RepID=UPI002AC84D21|nr:proteasome assembly chaperone 4 isoform X1 [Rhineura floridana]
MEEPQELGREGAERVSAGDQISLHNFCGRLSEQLVQFHAMRLRDSLFLWIGESPELSNLAVAMCTPRDSIPASTLLFGNASDSTSNSLAQRLGLSKKADGHLFLFQPARLKNRFLSAIIFKTQTTASYYLWKTESRRK